MSVDIIVGGQAGSEGKGKVISYLAGDYDIIVRSGGANAGHTIYHNGERHVFHMLPCGIFSPCKLMLGVNTYIDHSVLVNEITKYGINTERLFIDYYATIIDDRHKNYEKEMREDKMSTGSGVGMASSERIIRKKGLKFAKDVPELIPYCANVWELLNDSYDNNGKILVEGTQGMDLSLLHGSYPYVTSRDMSPGTLLGEVGLSPKTSRNTIMVLRTFPIRSCNGPLQNEISWNDVSKMRNMTVEEVSTVTKRVRRVGMFDFKQVGKAIKICRPNQLAITFVDYINSDDCGVKTLDNLSVESRTFIDRIESEYGVPVTLIGTGPSTDEVIDLRGCTK
ncbi:MAG: adenylosuccinate synthetase [Oscillospiraceae bacterium]|nr:adenylosuccinate synthetase [Oscillospiraceae bacterium]MCL2277946.1 adenylosuccinate synthetase [Oscillospiraceae bacterium]